MGQGKRVEIEDGSYSVHAVRRTTFPSKRYCLLLDDVKDKKGLTPFLTSKDIEKCIDKIVVEDMQIVDCYND